MDGNRTVDHLYLLQHETTEAIDLQQIMDVVFLRHPLVRSNLNAREPCIVIQFFLHGLEAFCGRFVGLVAKVSRASQLIDTAKAIKIIGVISERKLIASRTRVERCSLDASHGGNVLSEHASRIGTDNAHV